MSSKKRGSRARKVHRQGLSGNPQRRAQQLDQRARWDLSATGHAQADPGRAAFRELAYSLAGGALPEAWWRESHERILARARALTWPTRLAGLETQTCLIVGDEFYDRLRSPGTGLHPAQWLRALAEETGAALRATLTRGADDWQKLWALLCGLALMAPRAPADAAEEPVRERFPEFPDTKDPLETALAEAERFVKLAADREVQPGLGHLADGWRPAGEPITACDVYGSRRLVLAPFSYDGGAPDQGMIGASLLPQRPGLRLVSRAHQLPGQFAQHLGALGVASAGDLTDSAVSQIERGEVATIDAIARYIEALGGRLDLVASFGDHTLTVATTEAA